jgi:hypothetical protein
MRKNLKSKNFINLLVFFYEFFVSMRQSIYTKVCKLKAVLKINFHSIETEINLNRIHLICCKLFLLNNFQNFKHLHLIKMSQYKKSKNIF